MWLTEHKTVADFEKWESSNAQVQIRVKNSIEFELTSLFRNSEEKS